MPEPEQPPVNLASHQPSTQAKETAVLALICILRLLSQPLASDLKTSPGTEASFAANLVYAMAVSVKPYLVVIVASAITYLAIMQLSSRTIPRRMLDGIGILFAIFMLLQFIKINLLMIANAGPANVLLAEVVIYVFYFAVMWGWMLWRVDAATKPAANTVIELEAEKPPITMFDYYHASMESILHTSMLLKIRGITRRGRILVMTRNIMLLDLYAVVLGRFYQLIQKVI